MSQHCLNCGTAITDKYCAHCGQKADVHRLSWHVLGEEVLHFFTHIEHGFLKTTKELLLRPGKLFKDYLDGKRKTFHKPISFLLIWISMFLLIYFIAKSVTHYPIATTDSLLTYGPETTAIMNKYRSLIEIMILPFIALTGWLLLGRPRLHYVEVLTASIYTISSLFIFLSIQLLIALIIGWNFRTNLFDIITTSVYSAWATYAIWDFYRKYVQRFLLLRLLFALIVNVLVYFLLVKLYVKIFLWLHMV